MSSNKDSPSSVAETLVYSLGHSSRPLESIIDLLTHYRVSLLADVRRYPGSRRHPHFNREPLARALDSAGLAYLHLGDRLGGFRDRDYAQHLGSEPFEQGIEQLASVARRDITAFMCAEKNPWQCHRRFIAQALAHRDFTVRHIIDEHTLWDPETLLFQS